jgi:hypothetical protein
MDSLTGSLSEVRVAAPIRGGHLYALLSHRRGTKGHSCEDRHLGDTNMPKRLLFAALLCPMLVGCGRTSDVLAMEDGSYLVAASSTPLWEEPSDAIDAVHRKAQTFCASKGLRTVDINSRDSRSEAVSGYSGSSGGTGMFAAGSTSLNFKCI